MLHPHLLCDFVGSRGPDPVDLWPIIYFGPFDKDPMWLWKGQRLAQPRALGVRVRVGALAGRAARLLIRGRKAWRCPSTNLDGERAGRTRVFIMLRRVAETCDSLEVARTNLSNALWARAACLNAFMTG